MIHWLGAGLSSIPGVKRLASERSDLHITLWNRTLVKAEEAIQDISSTNITAKQFDVERFREALSTGDVVVSMLPATMHVQIAECCLAAGAHFVSSSYISEQMSDLDALAREKGLCFINEVGLDPGIDHLFAHELVYKYREWLSAHQPKAHKLEFRSYCGAFPAVVNDFRYKFSWSPAGVLRALKSPATYISNSKECTITSAWEDLTSHDINGETFEGYPNRNSLPFIEQYHLNDRTENMAVFIRGTLRQGGWANAWSEIFDIVKCADEDKLASVSESLYQKYAYEKGEADRVVLYVELTCIDENDPSRVLWKNAISLDEKGTDRYTALAKTVSYPTSIAVEEVLAGHIPTGVSAAPSDHKSVNRWLSRMQEMGINYSVLAP